jgi:hypothetical protein
MRGWPRMSWDEGLPLAVNAGSSIIHIVLIKLNTFHMHTKLICSDTEKRCGALSAPQRSFPA